MSAEPASPRALVESAESLLRFPGPATAGLWPRAAALIALDALETGVRRLWERQSLEFTGCSMRTQLICLRSYLEDGALAARAGHAWSALTRASHHHAYELAPTAAELASWFAVVRELVDASQPGGAGASAPSA